MNKSKPTFRLSKLTLILSLTFSVAAISGCEKFKNYTDAEHVQKAKEFQDKGKLPAAVIELKNALQKNSKNAEARWLLGEIYVSQGLGKEAEKELNLAAELGVDKEALKVPLGGALLQQQEFKRVLKEIEPSSNSSKTNTAKIFVLRGEANIGLTNIDEGCKSIKEAIDLDPTFIPAYYGSARCEGLRGNKDAAKAELEKALKINDKNAKTWNLLGDLERSNNKFTEAEAAYTNSLKIKPDGFDALTGRAANYLQSNKLTEATKDIDAAQKISKLNPLGIHLRGILQYRQGKYTEAKTSFEGALKSNSEFLPATLWLGLTNYALKNDEQAIKQLSQYVHAYPNSVQVQALLALVQARVGGKQGADDTLKGLNNVNIEDPQSLIAIGQAYILSGESEMAIRNLSKAIDQGSKEGDTRLDLARAYLQKGDAGSALEQLQKAAGMDKDPSNADVLLIQTYLKESRYNEALQASDKYLAKNTSNPRAHNFRGSALMLLNKPKEAQDEFKKALELSPGYPPAAHNLALMAIRAKDFDNARKHYQSVLDKHPDHLETLLSLYNLELGVKNNGAAKKALDLAFQKHPGEPAAAILMADSLIGSGQPSKAIEALREAERLYPNDIAVLEAKTRTQIGSGDLTNAVPTFKKIVQLQPRSTEAHYRLANIYAMLQDIRAAKTAISQALQLNPKHIKSKVLLAKLSLTSGNKDEALRLAKELEKTNPKSPEGYFLEANIALLSNDKKALKDTLDRVAKIDTLKPEEEIELATLYMRADEARSALPIIKSLQAKSPDRLDLLNMLGEAQLASGDGKAAVTTFKNLANASPSFKSVSYRLGMAQFAAGDYQSAKASFENSLKQNSTDFEAASALISLEIKNKKFSDATKIAQSIQKERPQSPVGFMLQGDILMAEKKFADAAKAYESAFDLRKTGALAMRVHSAYAQIGKGNQGYSKLAGWLKDNPFDFTTRTYLAEAYLRAGEYKLAQEQLEFLVKNDQGNVAALNNLAWLYQRDKRPEALDLANKAYRLKPDHPATADTLGWILIERGQLKQGIEVLQLASKKAPESSEIKYHLAVGLMKSGAKVEARKELEKVIASSDSSSARIDEAKALLKQLN